MTRNGFPIEQYEIRNSVNANIDFDVRYLEFSACIAARLDIDKWERFGYTMDLKADVIAWYLVRNLIENNVEDAKQKKQDQLAKRK